MNRPLIMLLKAGILVVFAILILGVFLTAGGRSFDASYTRFTQTHPPQSLFLGSSRVAQGLQPATFKEVWKDESSIEMPLLNYAFTLGHSPYGEAYLNSIKRKLKPGTTNGVFILGVDPWMISLETGEEIATLRETDRCVNQMQFVGMNPNFEYAIKFLESPWYRFWTHKRKGNLHQDGWFEITIKMDAKAQQSRLKAKIIDYEQKAKTWHLSEMRRSYLTETIRYLQTKGKVFLVRLPVSQPMEDIEHRFAPDFESRMQALSNTLQVPYLSYWRKGDQYTYTDGNHIWKESGQKLSEDIAQFVLAHMERP